MVGVYISHWYVGDNKIPLDECYTKCCGPIGCRLYRDDLGQIEQCYYTVGSVSEDKPKLIEQFVLKRLDFFRSRIYVSVKSFHYEEGVCKLKFSCANKESKQVLDAFHSLLGTDTLLEFSFKWSKDLWNQLSDICS